MVQSIDVTYSLLDDQKQKRAAEVARRERKNEESDLLAGLLVKGGMAIGNAVLKNKTYDFMNSTEQRSARQIATRADNNISYVENIFQQMADSKQTEQEFMMGRVGGAVEARLKSETPNWMESLDDYESILYKRKVEEANLQLKKLREAREIYEGKDMNNFEDRLDMVNKRYGPSNNLASLATSTVAGFLDGKSKEDVDIEELLAYQDFINSKKEGSRAYYAKKLQLIVESLEETGDMAASKAYADSMMLREPTPEERAIIITKDTVQAVQDTAVVIKTTEVYDPSSRFGITKPLTTNSEIVGNVQDLKSDSDVLKIAMDSFDIAKWVDDNFTEAAKSKFHKVTSGAGHSISNIKTLDQYNALATSFDSFASDTTNYKNKRADEFYNSMLKVYFEQVGYGKMLTVMKQRNSTNAAEREKGQAAYLKLMSDFGEFNLTANEVADLMAEYGGSEGAPPPAAPPDPEIVSTRVVESNVRTTGRGVGGKNSTPRSTSTPTISPQITNQATFDALTGNEKQFALSLLETDTEVSFLDKIRNSISLIVDPEINIEASPDYKEMIQRKYGITL